MPYNENIPQPTDRLKDSQPQLLGNFQAIDTVISVDHVTFDDPSGNQGMHKKVTLPTLPAPAFPITYNGMYSTTATTGQPEIFLNTFRGVQTINTQVAMTASILSTTAAPAVNSSGWTLLPSGIILKWGQQVFGSGSTGVQTVTFPVGATIPAFQNCITVQITPGVSAGDPNTMIYLSTIAAGGASFNVYNAVRSSGSNTAFIVNYLAIGY